MVRPLAPGQSRKRISASTSAPIRRREAALSWECLDRQTGCWSFHIPNGSVSEVYNALRSSSCGGTSWTTIRQGSRLSSGSFARCALVLEHEYRSATARSLKVCRLRFRHRQKTAELPISGTTLFPRRRPVDWHRCCDGDDVLAALDVLAAGQFHSQSLVHRGD